MQCRPFRHDKALQYGLLLVLLLTAAALVIHRRKRCNTDKHEPRRVRFQLP